MTKRLIYICLSVVCAAGIVISIASIVLYVLSSARNAEGIRLHARNDVNYRVYYVENHLFESGEMPAVGLHYLMSYTDYIIINNTISAEFNAASEIAYQYTASAKLLIKHQRGPDSRTNPVVYEEYAALKTLNGIGNGTVFNYSGQSAEEPGGVFIINPRDYIESYANFITEQKAQMEQEGLIQSALPQFSAELLVDFSYYISAKDAGITELFNHGLIIPLNNEVYNPESVGTPVLDAETAAQPFALPETHILLPFALGFVVLILGLAIAIRQLTKEQDAFIRKLNAILKSYSDDIVITEYPTNLSGYEIIHLPEFQELLKLSMNLGKVILCHHDNNKALFQQSRTDAPFAAVLTGTE